MDLPSLGKRERLVVRIVGYAAFFVACFLVMCWLLFPFNRWKGTLEEIMSRQLDRKVVIGSVGSWGLTGLKLRDVTITQVEEERKGAVESGAGETTDNAGLSKRKAVKKNVPLHIERLGLRIAIWPTLTGRVGFCFDARLFDGKVKGCFVDGSRSLWGGRRKDPPVESGPRSSLRAKVSNLDLNSVPHLEAIVGLPFHGIVDGSVDLSYVSGLPKTAMGRIRVEIQGLQIGDDGGKIDLSKASDSLQGELNFEPIVVGDFDIEIDGEGGQLLVKKLEAKSKHIEILGGGDVTLREPMLLSSLNIYVMFKFLPAYTDKSSMTKTIFSALDRIPKMRKAKRPDGFYGYIIRGDLRAGPKPFPSRTGPAGPAPGIAPLQSPQGKQSSSVPMGLRNKVSEGDPAGAGD